MSEQLVPLYKMWNPTVRDHLYTTDAAHRDHAAAHGWEPQGVAAHVFPATLADDHPLRRELVPLLSMWHKGCSDHFYTVSADERQAAERDGWKLERVEGHVFAAASRRGLVPLHRLWNIGAGDHLYTSDPGERERALQQGYKDEGVVAHVFPPDVSAWTDDSAGAEADGSAWWSVEASATTAASSGVFVARSTAGAYGSEIEAEIEAIQRKLKLELGARPAPAPRRETRAWEHLDGSMFADFEGQIKVLTQQLARLEVMLRHHARAVDSRFESAFNAWAEHFKEQLTTLVQSTIATLVEGHANTRLARQALQLKHELSTSIMSGVDERIDRVIAARLGRLQDDVVAAVERHVEHRMNALVDHKLGPVQQSTTAQVLKEIDALLQASVDQKLAGVRLSLDGDIDGRLLETQNKLERLHNELTARLTQGDARLKSWITAQLIELKGCMTDRQTLVTLLGEFVAETERRLAQAPCLDIHRWSDPSDAP